MFAKESVIVIRNRIQSQNECNMYAKWYISRSSRWTPDHEWKWQRFSMYPSYGCIHCTLRARLHKLLPTHTEPHIQACVCVCVCVCVCGRGAEIFSTLYELSCLFVQKMCARLIILCKSWPYVKFRVIE